MRFVKLALAAATLLPLTSHAVLGGAPNQASSAPMSLRATPQAASSTAPTSSPAPVYATTSYSVYESKDSDGITVREYVLLDNVVFAVSWQGPVRPDMKALLGNYFPNYVASGQQGLQGTGALIQRNGDLQVQSAGHLGHFFGTAYLPRLMPADLRANNLQ